MNGDNRQEDRGGNSMGYARDVRTGWKDAEERLACLQERIVVEEAQLMPNARLSEHLVHGAGRRILMLRRALENIFTLFPPETDRPLASGVRLDVQINLHAFLVNAYATNDNWAWAFVLRHALLDSFPRKTGIGLFAPQTTRHLPPPLGDYLRADALKRWRDEYAKIFRDATAHRIPPYIPPFVILERDQALHAELAKRRQLSLLKQDWKAVQAFEAQMEDLQRPALFFVNSLGADDVNKNVHLHAQVVTDSMTVAEIGEQFLDHWHLCVQ